MHFHPKKLAYGVFAPAQHAHRTKRGPATHTDLRNAQCRQHGQYCGDTSAQPCPHSYPSKSRKSGPEKRSIGSDFSATRHDLGKRRKTYLANVLNFMLPRLQRLRPSEHRVVLSQRSDFAEKQHNLALGSRSGWISPQRDTISANGEMQFRAM